MYDIPNMMGEKNEDYTIESKLLEMANGMKCN